MNTQSLAYIELIKSCGYRVFMRKPNDTYCLYTDGTRIGYAQWSERVCVTSVHKPNQSTGTGFGCGGRITPESLKSALDCYRPNWASGPVEKYKDWEAYHNASDWNRELQEV